LHKLHYAKHKEDSISCKTIESRCEDYDIVVLKFFSPTEILYMGEMSHLLDSVF